MGAAAAPTGPELSEGIALAEIPEGATIAGRVGEAPILLSRFEGRFFAVGGACTHYGAALSDGLVDGDRVRCPLHHACFSLRSGAALRAPAFDPLDRWAVETQGDRVFVRARIDDPPGKTQQPRSGVERIVILGGGGAGFACADELRTRGYSGRLTLISADRDPPCDRPNLSRDFLAGTAPEDWIPLRPDGWYRDREIDLILGAEIIRIDPEGRKLHAASGADYGFDRLLIATGAEPRRLDSPGFDRDNVFMLRSLADARAIADCAKLGARAVVIGSSFIGLEAAAALRAREVEVDVVALERMPFANVLGEEIGAYFRDLHQSHGVRFHPGTTAARFDGRAVRLASGVVLEADFVLVGVGVRPKIALAEAAGLAVDQGVRVDRFLQTDAPGIYAAGDIASYPDPRGGGRLRIEHWVTALRQGQVAAANMLGAREAFESVPFFWTEQYGVALRYTGHAAKWDEVRIEGDVAAGDFVARYFEAGELRAAAAVGRDLAILEDERRLEADQAHAPGTSIADRHPMPAE